MSSIVFVLFVVITWVTLTTTNPINSRSDLPWSRPCRSDHTASVRGASDFQPVIHSQEDLLDQLLTSTREAFDKAKTLKKQIFEHRMDSSLDQVDYLSILNIHPLPLPEDVVTWTHADQTAEVLKTNYRHLSYILAFLEITRKDCTVQQFNDDVIEHVQNLEDKVFSVLCHIRSLLVSLNLVVENYVTRGEIPVQVREMSNRARIISRDFIIARDSFHLLGAVKDSHDELRIGYQ